MISFTMDDPKNNIILALETSCDETAAALVCSVDGNTTVLSSVVRTQIELHAKYGGVVPNLAAREHVANIIPVIDAALEESGVDRKDISAIAVTRGPGLVPALLVGVSAAKTLSLVWKKPLLGVNHLEGHIYANFIGKTLGQADSFPLLALIVSGGHTELVLMEDHFKYEILGETRDDAAGEAFDKAARLLGLPYPGGPAIEKRARAFFNGNNRSPTVSLPRPMIDSPDLDFSFSGLKTAVLYLMKENEARKNDAHFIDEVAHGFQKAVVDVLVAKTRKAIEKYSPKTVIIAGGVSANARLRERMQELVDGYAPETTFAMPEFKYSLDNAAMIGAAAVARFSRLSPEELEELERNTLGIDADSNLSL